MKVLTLKEAQERGLVDTLKKKCDEMEDLNMRSIIVLDLYGRTPMLHIWELVEKRCVDLLKHKNFGRKSLNQIKETLHGLGLELNTRLTDALKTEIGAPLNGGEPHEDADPASVTVPTTSTLDFAPSLEELQRKLDAANEAIEGVQREIAEAKATLTRHEDRKRSLEFTIKNYTTIALALK